MRRRIAHVTAVLAATLLGCDGDSGPTASLEPVTTWSGSRTVVELTEGDGTCLADHLRERAVEHVEATLSNARDRDEIGSVRIVEPDDRCSVFHRWSGDSISWTPYKCGQQCWWASFVCDGRNWSYCRGFDAFAGTATAGTLVGEQTEAYRATDGRSEYLVRARYRYVLEAR